MLFGEKMMTASRTVITKPFFFNLIFFLCRKINLILTIETTSSVIMNNNNERSYNIYSLTLKCRINLSPLQHIVATTSE